MANIIHPSIISVLILFIFFFTIKSALKKSKQKSKAAKIGIGVFRASIFSLIILTIDVLLIQTLFLKNCSTFCKIEYLLLIPAAAIAAIISLIIFFKNMIPMVLINEQEHYPGAHPFKMDN